MVKKNIEKTIRKNNLINAGEHIVLGLSGGPDSVCLFSVLNELKDEAGFELHAVHVNHGFRPGDADEDQTYAETLCRESGVECSSFSFDCNAVAKELGLSSEEAGRKVRYDSFRRVAASLIERGVPENMVKIAVAQNADDQAETVLLRLLRGTGPDGLAGMAYSRMEGNICVIRPLLDTWREDIEQYCREKNLEPRTDKTNLQPIYTRNKIRLQLIPYLQENFNPNIMEALGRLSRIAGEDKEYLWQCAEEAYVQLETAPGILRQKELAQLPAPVRHRVIMKALQQQGLTQDVTSVHLEAADSILSQTGESRTAEFPDGYRMSVRYGEAAFYRVDDAGHAMSGGAVSEGQWTDAEHKSCGWNIHLEVRIEDVDAPACYQNTVLNGGMLFDADFPRENNSCTNLDSSTGKAARIAEFDYDKVTAVHGDAEIMLRSRREGDFLSIKGGRKKLQDLFIDMKVPKECRDSIKVAAIGSEILWLPVQPGKGVKKGRYSHRYKLDTDTKKCLILEIDCDI